MKNSLAFKLLIVVVFLASGCSSSKFDYNTAYQFSHHNYQKQINPTINGSPEPLASLTPVQTANPHLPSDRALKDMAASNVTSSREAATSLAEEYRNASKEERKAFRKEIKQKFKEARKDMKIAKKEASQQDVYFNKKMYIGVVIALAGIVVAILASGAVGALAIIVGIALIAWGFIEQA